MIFKIKCWIVRTTGGISGWLCGFLSGVKLANNGYNNDVAGYIFNKIHNENIEKWETKEKELIDKNPRIGLFTIIVHGFKSDIDTYREVCAEIKSNKSKWK